MTHMWCPSCGLRFSSSYASHATACPMCLSALTVAANAVEVLGQQLYFDAPEDPPLEQRR